MKRNTLMAMLAGLLLSLCGTARAQGPVAGQPYQVPAGYEAYGAGTLISYGGFNYVIQGNGTMLLAEQPGDSSVDPGPSDGQLYLVPTGYEAYGAGTLINYGGSDYVIQGDGTMLQSQQTGDSSADPGPADDQPYQVPAGYEAYGAGTLLNYGGFDYVMQGNGTMLLARQPFGYNSNYVQPGGRPSFSRGPTVRPGIQTRNPGARPGVRTNGPGLVRGQAPGRNVIQGGRRGGGGLQVRGPGGGVRGGAGLAARGGGFRSGGGGIRSGGGGFRSGGGGFRSGGGGFRSGGGGMRSGGGGMRSGGGGFHAGGGHR